MNVLLTCIYSETEVVPNLHENRTFFKKKLKYGYRICSSNATIPKYLNE